MGIILAVGCLIIGWNEFLHVLRFHKNVVFGSGLYGTGDQVVVSTSEMWRTLTAIPQDRAYAMLIAPVIGAGLVVGGLFAAWRGSQHILVGLICIGAGLASGSAAVFVLKHYEIHYTAGVSSTLPASIVACYLLRRMCRPCFGNGGFAPEAAFPVDELLTRTGTD
jgi:hypothetical protein